MKCPRCKSESNVKNGIIKGVQRYKCKNCHFNFTVEIKSTAQPVDVKKIGIMLYLLGLGFNPISRLLNVSHVTVIKWIEKYGGQLRELKTEKPVKIIGPDEMQRYYELQASSERFGLMVIELDDVTLLSLKGLKSLKPSQACEKI